MSLIRNLFRVRNPLRICLNFLKKFIVNEAGRLLKLCKCSENYYLYGKYFYYETYRRRIGCPDIGLQCFRTAEIWHCEIFSELHEV